ncbi:MAG: hypothetical protein OER12_09340, partial [Acidimicrobiia bacterium]|nr:hypothetical protein [Acidimicrobiia bacterium]
MRKIGAITSLVVVALFMVPLGAAAFGNGSAGLTCPLPTAPGVVIVDISEELMTAWNSEEASAGPVSVSVPAGTWDVYLVSYDDHSNKKHQAQTKEQWTLQGRIGESVVFTTNATPDLSETTDVEYFGVGSITTTSAIDNVVALHAAYPDTLEPHSVAPLCAAFYPAGTAPMAGASCPFPAGETVVNISTELLLAWDAEASMAGPVEFALPAGDWDVWLVSYDKHSAKSHQAQTREQWYLQGLAGSTVVFTSGITDDLAEDKDGDNYFVGTVKADQPIDAVKAVHAAYPADQPHSVAPLCAAFLPKGTNPTSSSTLPGTNVIPPTGGGSSTTTATTAQPTTSTTEASSKTVPPSTPDTTPVTSSTSSTAVTSSTSDTTVTSSTSDTTVTSSTSDTTAVTSSP